MMSNTKTENDFKLNLFENCISFLNESIDKAMNSENDPRSWKFALFHAVQSIELTLKEILRREHPVFVYENIDKPKNTIGIDTAISRLESLLKKPISKTDIEMIKEGQKVRNEIIHFEVQFSIEKIRVQYARLIGFLNYLHENYLNNLLLENLSYDKHEFLLQNQKVVTELLDRANQRILDESIDEQSIRPCPICLNDTFVITSTSSGICYVCQTKDNVEQCPGCEEYFLESDLQSFSRQFEYSMEEGREILRNDYGFKSSKCCIDCYEPIKEKIENERRADEYYRDMEGYYLKDRK